MVAKFEQFDLTGRTAVVTGGATGLGFHMARGLARSGANVVIAARREDVLKQACERIRADGNPGSIGWHPTDLADRASTQSLIDHCLSKHGKVDIFVGNAAATDGEMIPDIKMDTVDRLMRLNVSANLQLCQGFLPAMKQQRWGRIILSSSIGSVMSIPHMGMTTYQTTKGAVNALVMGIATDYGHQNVTANSLILGFFRTDLLETPQKMIAEAQGAAAAKAFIDTFASCNAMGRIADPEEIEGLVRLLASDAGSYITGANLTIDGGMRIMLRPQPVDE